MKDLLAGRTKFRFHAYVNFLTELKFDLEKVWVRVRSSLFVFFECIQYSHSMANLIDTNFFEVFII